MWNVLIKSDGFGRMEMTLAPLDEMGHELSFEAQLYVEVEGFEGRVVGNLRRVELASFHKELLALAELSDDRAELISTEGWIEVVLNAGQRGGISLTGRLQNPQARSNELRFSLSMDQSYLSGIAAAVGELLADNPVASGSDAR